MPPIGPYVHTECTRDFRFRRYPGEWEQLCVDPTKLTSLKTPSLGNCVSKCADSPVDSSPSAGGDGQFTTMFPTFQSEETKKDIHLQSVVSATSDDTKEATVHQTPTTLSTTSPDISEIPEATLVPPRGVYDNVQPSSFTCDLLPCRGRKFESLGGLQSHDDEAHHFRCEWGCSHVDYPSARDLTARHYGPFHKREAGQYRCGRCGETGYRQDNHTRHLLRKRPCRATTMPQKYACGRCGETTYSKDDHLAHLRRKACEAS